MTGREILIVAIAPLVVGLVVGVAQLEIEYSFFNKAPSDLKAEAKQTVEKVENQKVETAREPIIEPNVGDLQALLEYANKLQGVDARNAEFKKIASLALNEEKLGFALLVGDRISGVNARNEQFSTILAKCLQLNRLDLAYKAADYIRGVDSRNEAYKKIIDAGIKIRGKNEL